MTASDTSVGQMPLERTTVDAAPGFFRIGGRVLAQSLPLMVGSLAAAGQSIAKLGLLTYHGAADALYLFSMVQPGFILMLAFMESLAIASQVFSSKSVKAWPKGDVRRAATFFSVLGTALILLVAAGIYAARWVLPASSVMVPILPQMAMYVMSFLPFFLFEVRNAALRGQKRTALALLPFAVLIAVDLAVTAAGILIWNLGFMAILLGNVAGPIVAYPVTWVALNRTVGPSAPTPDAGYRRNIIRMLIGVALPTFLTTFAGSISAMVIFPMLARLGSDTVSSFLIVVRMRVLFIIPAIAAGSAIAILINSRGEGEHDLESRRTLIFGTLMIALIYVVATAALYIWHWRVVGLMVPQDSPALRDVTAQLMKLLILTFFLIGVGTMLQVILEHLGKGALVLFSTLVTEGLTIGAALYLLQTNAGLQPLTMVMTAAATLTTLIFAAFFLRLVKTLDAPHAV
jgi:Na+-driven multidrug efflux pump